MSRRATARVLLGAGTAAMVWAASAWTATAASSVTLSPTHGPVGQGFSATYTLPTAGRCSTSWVSFSWDGSGPGAGPVLATVPCSPPTSSVTASVAPPGGAAVGGHSVYGYFSAKDGSYAQVDSAVARYTVDPAAAPSPTPSSSPATNQPPTAVTVAATDIGPYSATLRGTINPHGCTLTGGGVGWAFPFGPTTMYGFAGGPSGSVSPTATTEVPVGGIRSGLSPATTYHFRLSVYGPCGGAQGGDMTFTTAAASGPGITATTLPATDVTDHSASLNGSINPHGCTVPGGGVGWSFPYGLTTTYGLAGGPSGSVSPTATTDLPVSGVVSGLSPSTTYHVRISVYGPCGGANGGDVSFTTTAATTPAITVTTLAATDVTPYSATLNGAVNPHGCTAPGGGVGWSFPVGPTTTYGLAGGPTGSVAPASTVDVPVSGVRTGLSPGTTYHFALSAFGPCGGGQGEDVTFTTPAATVAAMTVLTLPATDVTDHSATLNGTVNPHGCTAPGGGVGFGFSIGTSTSYGGGGGPSGGLPPTSTVPLHAGGSVAGLAPNTTYHVRLTASGPCGGGVGGDVTFTTGGGGVPLMVTLGGGLLGVAVLALAAFKLGWVAKLTH